MAQLDNLFTTENSDIQELDSQLNLTSIPDDVDMDDIIPATEADKVKKPAEKKPDSSTEETLEEEPLKIFDEMDEEEIVTKTISKSEVKTPVSPEEIKPELSELSAISEGLFKAGIWSRDEGEDENELPDTEEDFKERFDYEAKKLANDYVTQVASRHGEEAANLFDAIFVKGVDVKEYTKKWQQNLDFTTMDLNSEDNQVHVVETMLREQGIPEDKISEKIRKLKISEDLADEANTYHTILLKKQQDSLAKMQQDAVKKQETKKLAKQQYHSTIDNTIAEKLKTQDFDGVPINIDSANKLKETLKNEKWKLPDGTLVTDWDRIMMDIDQPQNYETKMKLALILGSYVPGKPLSLNIKAVEKRAASKENEKLFNLKGRKELVPSETKKNTIDLSDLY